MAISIHAPTWGATFGGGFLVTDFLFQSTHPRGVRRQDGHGQHCRSAISIHAPTWGATSRTRSRSSRRPISIHAPTWGATGRHIGLLPVPGISIHAPTWGATQKVSEPSIIQIISIHAPTWGATPPNCPELCGDKFQSTHPRGVRH